MTHINDPRIVKVIHLFEEAGTSQYGGEAVTQLEHALQAALLAEEAAGSPAIITAALLHDVGHLLHRLPDDAPTQGVDDLHEELGARWLAKNFCEAAVAPVRMHVQSKRYLCAKEPSYLAQLSAPSLTSLHLQGGPMSAAEAHAFEQHPHFAAAIAVRRWDDQAKVAQLPTPPLAHFLPALTAALLPT